MSRIPLAFLLVLALWPTSVLAQDRPAPVPPGRLWVGLGFGYGALAFRCDGCAAEGRDGATHFLGAVALVLDSTGRTRVGVELATWNRQGRDEAGRFVLVSVHHRPFGRRGVYLKAGLGPAGFTGVHGVDGPTERAGGLGLMVGAGWELHTDSRVHLTPVITVLHADQGDSHDYPGLVVRRGIGETVVALSVGLSWR